MLAMRTDVYRAHTLNFLSLRAWRAYAYVCRSAVRPYFTLGCTRYAPPEYIMYTNAHT